MSFDNFSQITWQQGCAAFGWSVIGLVSTLGVFELVFLFLK